MFTHLGIDELLEKLLMLLDESQVALHEGDTRHLAGYCLGLELFHLLEVFLGKVLGL